MNGLNLDEIAVLLELRGIACVVRNENEAEALRSVSEASAPGQKLRTGGTK